MKENKEIPIIYPEYLITDIAYSYSKTLEQFKEDLFLFTDLKENEEYCGENLAIKCISINKEVDIYSTHYTYLFLLNHFQKDEESLIKLTCYNKTDYELPFNIKDNESNVFVKVISNIYNIKDINSYNKVDLTSKELYALYEDLYSYCSWFSQLVYKKKEELK